MIVLAVTIRCKPEKAREAQAYFASFLPRARAEPGCVQYDLFQDSHDDAVFYFFERWADQAAFDRHSAQPYLREFHARFDELLTSKNEVRFLKPVDEPDSYNEGSFVVFTRSYHLKRGSCCQSGCRHCPFREPQER